MTKILICEDDGELRQRLVEAFKGMGATAAQAAEAIQTLGEHFGVRALSGCSPSDLSYICRVPEQAYMCPDEGNHPDGWYRKFEKQHGKRNLRSR